MVLRIISGDSLGDGRPVDLRQAESGPLRDRMPSVCSTQHLHHHSSPLGSWDLQDVELDGEKTHGYDGVDAEMD